MKYNSDVVNPVISSKITWKRTKKKNVRQRWSIFWVLRWGHQVRALEGEGADSELLFFLQAQVVQVTEVIQAVQVAQVKAVDPGVRWGQGMEGGRWMVATICCPGAGGVATGASLPRHRPPTHRRNSLLPLAKPATIWNQDSDFLSTFCKTFTTT